MNLRKLGKFGPDISPIGIGAMSFSNFYGATTETQSHRILHAALAQGISHIDTANVYGMGVSETAIGNFLTQNKASAAGQFTLATKAGIRRDSETGNRFFDNSAEHLAEELDNSLKRLKVETIDLFYVHRRDANRPIEEVTQTLASFVQAGKIRSFGFSEIAPSSLKKAAEIHHVAAVQSEYSLAVRSPELGLVQATKQLGTALVAFSPLGRSLLTDRPHTTQKIATMGFLKNNALYRAKFKCEYPSNRKISRIGRRNWHIGGGPINCLVATSKRAYYCHPRHALCAAFPRTLRGCTP